MTGETGLDTTGETGLDTTGETGLETPTQTRLDVWLWCARFRRTRADCARLVEAGAVRLNRRPVDKPGTRVRPGDIVTIATGTLLTLDGSVRVVRIATLARRRGSADAARRLYEEIG